MKYPNPTKNLLASYGSFANRPRPRVGRQLVSSSGQFVTVVGYRLPRKGDLYLKPSGHGYYDVFAADCDHDKKLRSIVSAQEPPSLCGEEGQK